MMIIMIKSSMMIITIMPIMTVMMIKLIMMIVIDYNKSAVFSALHDELVSTATLANVAKHIGLGDIILCSVSTYGYSS